MTISDVVKVGIRGGIPNVTAQNALVDTVDDFTDHIAAKAGVFAGATFDVETEADTTANTVIVTIQLVDEAGDDLTVPTSVRILLFKDAAGADFNTTGDTDYTSVLIATDGTLAELTEDMAYQAVSEDDGDIDIKFLITGAGSSFLAVMLPNGKMAVSDEIVHT